MAAQRALARIPSLDGLRSLAVWLTIGHHLAGRFDIHPNNPLLRAVFDSGDGVGIFFVLSGYLITHLLLLEFETAGEVDLGAFYLRRAFRILPPLYTYALLAIGFCLVAGVHFAPDAFLSPLLFYRDYSAQPGFFLTEHTWSLSIEEQFYLLWPPLLIFCMRRGGKPLAVRAGLALILLTPILRVAGRFAHIAVFQHREMYMLHTRMDALMCGCVLALLIGNPLFERCYRAFAKVWWIAPLYTLFLAGLLYDFPLPVSGTTAGVAYTVVIGLTLDSVCMALFLLWTIRNPTSWVGRVLNSAVMVFMGVLSYSAYLWQTFFIHPANPSFLAQWPWLLAYIWAAAWLSHRLVEQPALSLRRRIQRWREARRLIQMAGAGAP